MISRRADRLLSTGEYHRDNSYFDGIPELMATGLPEGKELQILETVRDKVPAEVFTTPYKNPVERQRRRTSATICAKPRVC